MKKWIVLATCVVLLLVAHVITRSDSPAFCKVRFGSPEMSEVLFARSNGPLYARSNGSLMIYRDGDARSTPEVYPMENWRLKVGTEIPPFHAGGSEYKVTECADMIESMRHSLLVYVTVEDSETKYRQYCDVEVGQEPPNVAHFDGELSILPLARNWVPPVKKIIVGGEPMDLRVNVGSFDKSIRCWTVVESHVGDVCNFPEGVFPIATVEFPSGDPDKPIVESFPLEEFC